MLATSLIAIVKSCPTWILKKFGYKIVPLDDFRNETTEVDFNYPQKSIKCVEEEKSGARFCWSGKYNIGYEKYFEVENGVRRYFMCRNQILWIKRTENKT